MRIFVYVLIKRICFFQIRPHLDLTFDNILSHINTVYVLRVKSGVINRFNDLDDENVSLRLKGQMLYVPESDLIIFLCYPSVLNLDDLIRYNKNELTFPNVRPRVRNFSIEPKLQFDKLIPFASLIGHLN